MITIVIEAAYYFYCEITIRLHDRFVIIMNNNTTLKISTTLTSYVTTTYSTPHSSDATIAFALIIVGALVLCAILSAFHYVAFTSKTRHPFIRRLRKCFSSNDVDDYYGCEHSYFKKAPTGYSELITSYDFNFHQSHPI